MEILDDKREYPRFLCCGMSSISSPSAQCRYEQASWIDRQLQLLQSSAQPEARQITPLLKDFGVFWKRMTLTEWRAFLQAMFSSLYFDSQNRLQKVAAYEPFDRLLSLVKIEFAQTSTESK